MDINKQIKKITNNEYIFSVLAKMISILTGLLYSILFARYLGPELRGESAVILNNAELVSLVLCFGVYQAYPYYRKQSKEGLYEQFINNICGLFFVYIICAAIISATGYLSANSVFAIILAPILMAIKQLNYLVLIENPKVRNTANIKLDIFDIAFLSLLLIFTEADYFKCIMFLFVKQLVFLLIAVKNLNVNIFKIRPTLKGILPYIKYGFVPMITVILMEINYKVDVIMLERFEIPKVDIGIYSLGVMLAQKLWMIPDALKDILLSKLAKGKTATEVARVTRLSFFVTLCTVLGMVVFGKPLIHVMYGKAYTSAYSITIIILAGVLGMVFYKMVYSFNVVNGHKNINLAFLAIAALTNIIVNAVMIPRMGTYGAALASLLSCSTCGLVFLGYFCVHTKTKVLEMVLIQKQDIKMVKSFLKR